MRDRLPTEDLAPGLADANQRPDTQPTAQGIPPLRAFGVPDRQKQPAPRPRPTRKG